MLQDGNDKFSGGNHDKTDRQHGGTAGRRLRHDPRPDATDRAVGTRRL